MCHEHFVFFEPNLFLVFSSLGLLFSLLEPAVLRDIRLLLNEFPAKKKCVGNPIIQETAQGQYNQLSSLLVEFCLRNEVWTKIQSQSNYPGVQNCMITTCPINELLRHRAHPYCIPWLDILRIIKRDPVHTRFSMTVVDS